MQAVILQHQLFRGKFARVYVHADGTCLFHAVALALNIDDMRNASEESKQETGHALRQWLVRESEWSLYSQHIFDTSGERPMPFKEVKKTTTYVDEYVINFVSKRLGMSLIILQDASFIYDTNPQATVCVLLAYHQNLQHYEPIVAVSHLTEQDQMLRVVLKKTLKVLFSNKEELNKAIDNIFTSNRGVFLRTDSIIKRILSK